MTSGAAALAPVVLFAFNRPAHLERCIEAHGRAVLARNSSG